MDRQGKSNQELILTLTVEDQSDSVSQNPSGDLREDQLHMGTVTYKWHKHLGKS